jgi:threonine dehydratase
MQGVPVTYADVQAAAAQLEGVAHRTPVMTSSTLDRITGARVFLKCENFQRSGAFKFRGAYNAMSRLSDEQKSRGVLTYSSGNHAQALALAGSLLGVEVTVVMPADAPAVKKAATLGYGGHIVEYERDETSREALGAQIADEKGLTVIPPYDHPHIVAGQGTTGKELFEETGPLDVLVTPCGGGGLLSGCALSARALSPNAAVYGCEPKAGDDAARSLKSGRIETVHNPDTVADGARTPSLSELTFALIRTNVDGIVTVSDDELLAATRFLWERTKLVVEPTGALGVAALLSGRVHVTGQTVGVVISGGNADVEGLGRLFTGLSRSMS